MRPLVLVTLAAALLLTGCGTTEKVSSDAAVQRFCADTAGVSDLLHSGSTAPDATARLTAFDQTLAADVSALQQAGDAAVAAEAQVIQSLVSSQLVGGALDAGQNAQLEQAASMVARVRDDTC